jgi:AcrR family transcriptional regulator
MPGRRYEQRRRAEQAARTRRKILDAVDRSLGRAPSEPISIERIAAAAGVARSTIYAIFGSRAGLFDAVAADVFARAGYDRVIEAARQEDPRAGLRDGLRAATEMFAARRDLIRALYSIAQLDPQSVGGAVGRIEAERAAGMERLARRLGEQGHLREGLSTEQAERILWMLTSFESFDLLHGARGLPPSEVSELLITTAERTLLRAGGEG